MKNTNVNNTMDEAKQEELMAKYDREFSYRKLSGVNKTLVFVITVIWSLWQVYTATFGLLPPTLQRSIHVGFGLVVIYLLYPMTKNDKTNKVKWYDFIFIVLSVGVVGYHVVNFENLLYRAGAYNQMDMIVSLIAIALIIEGTRRVAGPVLITVSGTFLLYAYFGQYFPGFLSHGGYSIPRIATYAWISTESILGIPIMVSSTFIFLFLLFASYLKKTGIGDWLTDLALAIAGGATGGPAKAAIVASASQGTISGSSVANTVGTGSVTIPLMKSIGYRSEFAAAVEAAASTGGQLMPPIMGAAAFIMTEFTDLPYVTIALGASIPAFLYFVGIFIMVHLEAKKNGLEGLPKERIPNLKRLLKEKWFLATPIFAIVFLLVKGYTPMRAALMGILSTIIIGFINSHLDENVNFGFKELIEGLEEGAKSALAVVMACASAGIIVGVVTLTGLGIKFANGIVALSQGNIFLTMFFTMIASIVLGMGMPTTANYIVQATIAAPALIAVGVPVLAAHLFVFYFGIIADITPPVALAAFAGSGIAGSNPFKTGVQASMLAFAAYLVPYVFATSPSLVLVFTPESLILGSKAATLIISLSTALLGMFAIGGGVSGYSLTHCKSWERLVLGLGGVLLVMTNLVLNGVGLGLVVLVWLGQKNRVNKQLQV
ncbi:MAG: TRAP transporter permease [Anaeromicrobium sp.]|jgi:TRAP transporter 4TM/12TM fusion protein|uniref:TRAP transporter permease n=1 Tax=Anaeromicrobium sp. TaxID=1929132 RepID=UPI0025F164A1|nr:TRAP transporter permease [Anaeromicrobium sp.]MCT4596106.1 TRAP transporter permease [Anaeromicrobium sp.]